MSSSSSSETLIAVITGGGTGFGRQQALMLSSQIGATVILVGRRREPLQQVQSELSTSGRSHIIVGDVALLETWKAIAEKVEQDCGGMLHFFGKQCSQPRPRKAMG